MQRLKLALAGILGLLTTSALLAQQQGQQGQVQAQGQAKVAVQGFTPGTINQTPWFGDPAVRQSLKLSDEQFNRLNKSYGENYIRYKQGLSGLGNTLSEQQRIQKMNELSGQFNQGFNRSTEEIFTTPEQRQRYNQIYLQYQGYGAFSDPMLRQKLNLTDEQLQKINQYNQEWNTQMGTLYRDYQTDRQGASKRFEDMRRQMGTRIGEVLNEQQERTWREITGEPFSFGAGAYFPSSTGATTTPPKQNP